MSGMAIKLFEDNFRKLASADRYLATVVQEKGVTRRFRNGEQLYHEGESCPGIVFLLGGEIRVFKTGGNGREITLYQILPGETCILNAVSILSHSSYPANAVALQDGVMLYLDSASFLELMGSSNVMREFVFALFSQRFGEVIELVEEVTFGRLQDRLENYLIEKSEDNELFTTHQRIANELGSSREVISRLLKDLERQGKILQERNHIRLI